MVDSVSGSGATTAGGSKAAASSTRLAESFDTFLKLLTTQLQFQDPLDPMDSNAFTQQLVSFTGVEQSIQTNKNLESLISLIGTNGLSAATSYIGKTVTVDSATAGLANGSANWSYTLGSNAADLALQVLDSKGVKVAELTGPSSAGTHAVSWNGVDSNGRTRNDGAYTLKVIAKTATDASIPATVRTSGAVDAVETADGTSTLVVNGVSVSLADVLRVGTSPNTIQ